VHRRLKFDDGEVLIERRVAASEKHFMSQRWPDGWGSSSKYLADTKGHGSIKKLAIRGDECKVQMARGG
jgi:hypothetical protein